MVDSEDYAPNDPEVQEKQDVNGGSSNGDSGGAADTEAATSKPTTAPAAGSDIDFPSHSGTHSISGGKDFWSMKIDIPAEFLLEYTVENKKKEKFDFDAFVFDPAEYQDYRSKVGGGSTNPNAINKASVENVKDVGERSVTLAAGVYHFVVDNTDIGDAGDWGSEETRTVHVELTTQAA